MLVAVNLIPKDENVFSLPENIKQLQKIEHRFSHYRNVSAFNRIAITQILFSDQNAIPTLEVRNYIENQQLTK